MRATGIAIALAVALSGCAAKLTATTKDHAKAAGFVTTHCSAYGPFKTTKADPTTGKNAKVRLGAAVVCEK